MLMYIFQGIVLSGMACTQEPLELVLSLKAVTAFQKRFDARHFSESGFADAFLYIVCSVLLEIGWCHLFCALFINNP